MASITKSVVRLMSLFVILQVNYLHNPELFTSADKATLWV